MQKYNVNIRCYFPNCKKYTRHFQELTTKEIEKWIEAYTFTHPDIEAISLKVYIQNQKKGERKMKISIDNGTSFRTAKEAIGEIMENGMWERVVGLMEDETREAIAREYTPCTEEEYLTAYLKKAKENLIIG